MNEEPIFQQLFDAETSTYTYLLADKSSGEAVIIDPVLETVDRDLKLITELGLKLIYVLDTHIHADHITGAGELRKQTNAKTGVSEDANVDCVDLPLHDGQELQFGRHKILAIATPGHTNSCMSFYIEGKVFTGDSLMIRSAGRTDFQQGSSQKLYSSIHEKIFTLPKETAVYPGHDYRGYTSSTIEAEVKYNPRVGGNRNLDEFIKTMSELNLANPKKIHEAVPANMACGGRKNSRIFHPQVVNGVPEISSEDLKLHLGQARIIDVRGADEFNNQLGHIPGAELVTLGADLEKWISTTDATEEIVFVCRSGGRSGQATMAAQQRGLKFTVNMQGGMIRWNDLGYPTSKNGEGQ